METDFVNVSFIFTKILQKSYNTFLTYFFMPENFQIILVYRVAHERSNIRMFCDYK